MKLTLLALGAAFVAALPAPIEEEGCIAPAPTKHSSSSVATHPATTKSSVSSTTVASTVAPTATAPVKHSGGANPFTSNGIKAGLSGYPDIGNTAPDAMNSFAEVIGWYSDYTAITPNLGSVEGIPMVSFRIYLVTIVNIFLALG